MKHFRKLNILFCLVLVFYSYFLIKPEEAKATYDQNMLCSDEAFINTRTLNEAGIQNFLVSNNSFLKDFTENGRKASKIIYDAAQENGMNPIAILSTIQKEEGLISGYYATHYVQTRVDWAMGYGYTDSVIYDRYRGFTNQIEYGTWQLKRNYSYWATNGSQWNVGKSMTIDGTTVTFRNKCTSSLYRYTPHLHGNVNFNRYFNLWGGEGVYNAQYINQGPRTGLGVNGTPLLPGQSFTAWVNFKNTGNTTWRNTGLTPVQLGTWEPVDRASLFLGSRNIRGRLSQSSVAPGQIGTFKIRFKAPEAEGTYVEKFRPVVEYVGRMGDEVSWTYTVSKAAAAQVTSGTYVTQGPKTGPGSYGNPLSPGQTISLWVQVKNTGKEIWFNDGNYPAKLGTYSPMDRTSVFLGGKNKRGYLVQSRVLPGQTGTFKITITAPSQRGDYVEHFRPLMEGVTWFGPDVSWPLQVR